MGTKPENIRQLSSRRLRMRVAKCMFYRDQREGLREAHRVLNLLQSRMSDEEDDEAPPRLTEVTPSGR